MLADWRHTVSADARIEGDIPGSSKGRRSWNPWRSRCDSCADCQIFDVETLEEMKSYVTETPLNSACIAPLRPYVGYVQR